MKLTFKHSLFLNSDSEQLEREIKKTIPFTKSSKRIKYLEINVIKEVKTYAENYKTLLKVIKENTNKLKDTMSWLGKPNIVVIQH